MKKNPDVSNNFSPENMEALASSWSQIIFPYLLNFFTAIILIIIGFMIARTVSRFLRSYLEKLERIDKTLIPVLAQLSHYTILIFTLILVLAEFGIQTTSIIAVLGAAGLAIGLALQGTLQNVAAGIMLLIIRPFQVGDYIESAGVGGTVDEIGLFMTRMHTPQGIFIAVPNSKIWSDIIINYSKRAVRRLDLLVGISYDDDIDKAVGIMNTLITEDKRILKRPQSQVVVKELGESSVDLEIRAWTRGKDYWDLKFDMTRAVKYQFDKEGISIPYPHRQIITQTVPVPTEQKKRPRKKTQRSPKSQTET